MTQETITSLIIGGAIGFIFSALTSVIAYTFQAYRDNQEHKWELEKQKQIDSKKIVIDRLETLEKQVTAMMSLMQSAFSVIENLFFSNEPDPESIRNFREKYLIPIANERLTMMTNVFYFHDEELRSTFMGIYELIDQFANFYNKLSKVKDQEESKKIETIVELKDWLSEVPMDFSTVFGRFFTRSDVIKVQALDEFKELKYFDELETKLNKMRRSRKP